MNKHCHLSHHKHISFDIQSLFKRTVFQMSPTRTPHFFCCRHFKKHLKRWKRKGNEVATYEVQVLHACIAICRPNFEVPVWQNSSFLSLFLQILERKTTSFKSFLATKTFRPKQPHSKWFNMCQEEFEKGRAWF